MDVVLFREVFVASVLNDGVPCEVKGAFLLIVGPKFSYIFANVVGLEPFRVRPKTWGRFGSRRHGQRDIEFRGQFFGSCDLGMLSGTLCGDLNHFLSDGRNKLILRVNAGDGVDKSREDQFVDVRFGGILVQISNVLLLGRKNGHSRERSLA